MSILDPHILDAILERIIEAKQDLTKAEQKQDTIIAEHDTLRDYVYVDWNYTDFKRDNTDTYPPVLKHQALVLENLDSLNRGVGFVHELVIKYRYPELQPEQQQQQQEQQQTPMQMQQGMGMGGSGNPVVINAGNREPSIKREDASRVRSFWTGFHERKIEKMRLEHEERMAQNTRRMDVTTEKVERDPIEGANELMAALNATKRYITDCFLVWDKHRNKYFAKQVHENFRARVARLLGVIESYVYAATDLAIKEIRHVMSQQTHYYTRILEAQAATPTTIQEINKPVSEKGYWSSDDFEVPGSQRQDVDVEDELGGGDIEILSTPEPSTSLPQTEEEDEVIEI